MTERPDNHWIIVGKVGAPYGVKGWLKIQTYTESQASLLDFPQWTLESPQKAIQTVAIEEGKAYGDGLVVKFKGTDTPEIASRYTHHLVIIKRSQLPALNPQAYYWSDLEGCRVIDKNSQSLGVVAYLMETGSNDVLVIKDATGKEHAIPFIRDSVILTVDLTNQLIQVDWELL